MFWFKNLQSHEGRQGKEEGRSIIASRMALLECTCTARIPNYLGHTVLFPSMQQKVQYPLSLRKQYLRSYLLPDSLLGGKLNGGKIWENKS